MPSTRVATKLHLPKPRPDLVERPRLAARLDRGSLAKLTLISAPTGFGKTSLVAQWLTSRTAQDHHLAWIALDPADDEITGFWTQVLAGVGQLKWQSGWFNRSGRHQTISDWRIRSWQQ